MKKVNHVYEPHLVFRETHVAPKVEWTPNLPGLTLIYVKKGNGYFLRSSLNQELLSGTVLLLGPIVRGSIRASQLGELSLSYFNVIPSRLGGLLTWSEQKNLEQVLSSPESSYKYFATQSYESSQMEEMSDSANRNELAFRLKMLQLMAKVARGGAAIEKIHADMSDAGQRLENFLNQTPISDLLEMNFSDIAQMTNCTSRHLSRLFQKLVGMSFNDKRAELRLARALDLLATSNLKVVDVALESGFKSLSQFNQVFARRFGVSPGRWRNKNSGENSADISGKNLGFDPAKGKKMVFKLNASHKRHNRNLATT